MQRNFKFQRKGKKIYIVRLLILYASNVLKKKKKKTFQSDYGVILPDWASKVFPTRLAQVTSRSFVLNAFSKEMRKLKGGTYL